MPKVCVFLEDIDNIVATAHQSKDKGIKEATECVKKFIGDVHASNGISLYSLADQDAVTTATRTLVNVLGEVRNRKDRVKEASTAAAIYSNVVEILDHALIELAIMPKNRES